MASTLVDDPRDRAFERLYRRYARDVYRFALVLLRNPAEAEDVTQTTFLNAYRALQAGEEPVRPRSWLLTICHNAARSRVRAAMRRPREVPLEAAAGGLAAREEAQTDVRELVRALGQLPSNQRSAITMRELEGRSYPEIAQTLGVTVPAVDALLARARRSLRLHTAAIRGLTVAGLPRSLRKLFEHVETAAAGALGAGVAIKVGAMVAASVAAGGVGSAGADTPAASTAAQPHVARIAAPARAGRHASPRVATPAHGRRLRARAAPAATATAAVSVAVPAAPPNDATSRPEPPPAPPLSPPSSQPSAPADAAAPAASPTAPATVVQQAAPVVDTVAGAAASLPPVEDVSSAVAADPPVAPPPAATAPLPPVLPPPPAVPPAPLPSLGP